MKLCTTLEKPIVLIRDIQKHHNNRTKARFIVLLLASTPVNLCTEECTKENVLVFEEDIPLPATHLTCMNLLLRMSSARFLRDSATKTTTINRLILNRTRHRKIWFPSVVAVAQLTTTSFVGRIG